MRAWREEKKRYTAQEIIQYYEICLESLHRQVCAGEENRYSRTVSEMVRYIRKNYKEEITLELLGEKFQMNGVYLGQMFKKEVGVTFLKYLTNLRMKEAKRLLGEKKQHSRRDRAPCGISGQASTSARFLPKTWG